MTGCTASANTGDGIKVDSLSRVEGNTCEENGEAYGAGVHVTGQGNRIDGNTVTRNVRGIDVDSGGNLVVRNDASLNTTNFDIVPAMQMPTSSHRFQISFSYGPWANFKH